MAPVVQKPVSEDEILGLPKWVWAAIAGGVITAGLAIYIFAGSDGEKKKKPKAKKKIIPGTTETVVTPSKEKPISSAKSTPSKSAKVTVEDVPEEEDIEEIQDPLEKALAAKNKGNKYFRGGRYELAIKCYTQAIESCPEGKKSDLSTFYQNRAAAYEQQENDEAVVSDCTMALKNNSKYVKAMERRARTLRKQAEKLRKKEDNDKETLEDIVLKLKTSLEDCTGVCILEGFQKQEPMILVDAILKELGRAEARLATTKRTPSLASNHFISQYFQSFAEDPILKKNTNHVNGAAENGDVENGHEAASSDSLKELLDEEKFEKVIDHCSELIKSSEEKDTKDLAQLLRGTFYILCKQQDLAMSDLSSLISDDSANPKIRTNALIKRASLYIQQCKDPIQDPLKAMEDFKLAVEIDPDNSDIYHHRGQVHLLTEQIDNASEDFKKAVDLNPEFPVAYVQKLYTDYRKAIQKNDQELIKNVINLFKQAKEKFPKCVETYALFAQVLSDQSKFEQADELYQEALKVDPNNANLYVHRGLIHLQWKGDIEKAVELITKSLDVDDKCEFAYETLGTIEVQRGHLKKAIELFEKAIPLANTELEMGHLYGLRDAAIAQTTVSTRLGISLPGMMG